MAPHVVDRLARARAGVAQREPQLVLELPVARLDDDEPPRPLGGAAERVDRERPDRLRAEEPDRMPSARSALTAPSAMRAGVLHATTSVSASSQRKRSARCSAAAMRAYFSMRWRLSASRSVSRRWIEDTRFVRCARVAGDRPARQPRPHERARQLDLAGHLAEVAVGEDDDRVPVAERQLEREHREVEHLLRRRRREHDRVRVAVAEAAAGELQVRLLRADVPEPGPGPHHVHEHARQLRADHVRDALEHQAEARRRRERHRPLPRRARAVHHVDRGDLARRLEERAAEPGRSFAISSAPSVDGVIG